MAKAREDLSGRKFGRLTVVEPTEDYVTPKGKRHARYLCKCDCCDDKYVKVTGYNLKGGSVRSCGCLQKEKLIKRSKKYNDYEVQEDYVIMYTQKGEMFLVDLEDFWKVKDICWHKHHSGYFIDRNAQQIHRLIMDAPDGLDVDHKHGSDSKYDNRKENLRLATTSQNTINRIMSKNNTSGVVGVSWHKKSKKWRAYIGINNKMINLGFFKDKDDAIAARKIAEEKYFGEWSYDNSRMDNRGI